jgi:F0F1-type ATP synthase assembly protein I
LTAPTRPRGRHHLPAGRPQLGEEESHLHVRDAVVRRLEEGAQLGGAHPQDRLGEEQQEKVLDAPQRHVEPFPGPEVAAEKAASEPSQRFGKKPTGQIQEQKALPHWTGGEKRPSGLARRLLFSRGLCYAAATSRQRLEPRFNAAMPGNDKRFPSWIRHAGIGLELAGAVAGFALLGYWFDRHFGSKPWGLVVGLALGMVGGLYNLVKEALAASREARAEDEARDAPSDDDRFKGVTGGD